MIENKMYTDVCRVGETRGYCVPCITQIDWDYREAKENQHYVWRYYLWDWSDDGGKHVWRRKRGGKAERGKLEHTANSVMAYSIPDLSLDELREVDSRSKKICPDEAIRRLGFSSYLYSMLIRKVNEQKNDAVACIEYACKEKMLSDDAITLLVGRLKMDGRPLPCGYRIEEDRMTTEGYESLMTITENDVKPVLKALRSGCLNVLSDENCSARFVCYLLRQHFRTKKYFKAPADRQSADRIDYFLRMFEADRLGRFFTANGPMTYTFLHNSTRIPFLTSDRPVINMSQDSTSWDLFFPVSRTLSLMFMPKGRFESRYQRFKHVGEEEVSKLNQTLSDAATDEIYGCSETLVNGIVFPII